ncbi:MAG TPA: acetate/propionate family kinase [Acetobacteraceae bacterium]
MPGTVLTLNAGSSSLKFSVFDGLREVLRGQVSGIGTHPQAEAKKDGRHLDAPALHGTTHEDFLPGLLDWIGGHLDGTAIAAAGHRVVHGGTEFMAPVRVTDEVIAALEALVPLAPLHQPHNIAAIRAVAKARPDLPQAACFDTAFHGTMPEVATWLALPRAMRNAGMRRYGFHGLSYEFIAGRLRELAPGLAAVRVLVAHLGNGASLCAMRDGRSLDTTMGFTALDGLMMATRCGSLDPGAVLYLMQSRGMSADELEDVLYHGSGLLGVSGLSGDMRDLAGSGDPRAQEAIDLFVYRIVGCAGGLIAGMGGLDGIVFTAGIGEHDPAVRAAVCAGLSWLGLALDDAANAAGGTARISTPGSRVEAWVIPTDEEAVIARHTLAVLAQEPGRNG